MASMIALRSARASPYLVSNFSNPIRFASFVPSSTFSYSTSEQHMYPPFRVLSVQHDYPPIPMYTAVFDPILTTRVMNHLLNLMAKEDLRRMGVGENETGEEGSGRKYSSRFE